MTNFEELPAPIRRHLDSLAQETSITPPEEARKRVTQNWLEKRSLYEEQIAALAMVAVRRIEPDDVRGSLLLTRSGSLLALGPANDGGRRIEYASINLRTDVPTALTGEGVRVVGAIEAEHMVEFESGPIAKSSEILEIATFDDGVSVADQTERLRQAMIFLTNGFVQANQTLSVTGDHPDQFTMRSILKTVAKRNDATQTLVKSIVDDFLETVETGILLGRRVPVGRIGRVELAVRSAQKARMGHNPATGEELLIPPKAAAPVPRMHFSGAFRERAARVPVDRIQPGEE